MTKMLASNKDLIQKKYLDILSETKSILFKNYDLKQGLYNETYFCQNYSIFSVCKLFIKTLFFKSSYFECSIEGNDLLTFYSKNYRADHDSYWNLIISTFQHKDSITVEHKFKSILSRVDFLHLISKIYYFVLLFFCLNKIDNLKDRCYLSLTLVTRKCELNSIEKLKLAPKVVMCLFDSSPLENFAMQYFKMIGAVTITNQHGNPVYISDDTERVNQSQLFNFKSDYFFAKGPFQQQNFKRFGVPIKKIVIVGDLSLKEPDFNDNNQKVFCVLLDTLGYSFASEYNYKLIEISQEIAKKIGYRYIVKLHPFDDISRYENYHFSECIKFYYGADTPLKQIFKQSDFAICHASSSFVDSFKSGLRCFRFKTPINFPISSSTDEFSSSSEFCIMFDNWMKLSSVERKKYITNIVSNYSIPWKYDFVNSFISNLILKE